MAGLTYGSLANALVVRRLVATLSIASVLVGGCGAESGDASDDLIEFPASAYANAVRVSYGSTTTRPFKTADGFVAVRFAGKKGDTVRTTITSSKSTVSYLVLNKKNQLALREQGATPGVLRYDLAADGEYFVMMRTGDRSNASITIKLEQIAGNGAAFYTKSEIESWVAGSPPQFFGLGTRRVDKVGIRSCVAATGCAAPTETRPIFGVRKIQGNPPTYDPNGVQLKMYVDAAPSGVFGSVELTSFDSIELVRHVFDPKTGTPPSGKVQLAIHGGNPYAAPVDTPFEYTVAYSRTEARLTLRSEIKREGSSWTEYYGTFDLPLTPRSPVPKFPKVTPTASDVAPKAAIDSLPLDDEEVISRFAPGTSTLDVLQLPVDMTTLFVSGRRRLQACGPRTGCTESGEVESYTENPMARVLGGWIGGSGNDSYVRLKITGTDSYEVILKHGISSTPLTFPIERGVGAWSYGGVSYVVKVTKQGLLFEAPVQKVNETYSASFNTVAGVVSEPGYTRSDLANPTMLLRFNRNWP